MGVKSTLYQTVSSVYAPGDQVPTQSGPPRYKPKEHLSQEQQRAVREKQARRQLKKLHRSEPDQGGTQGNAVKKRLSGLKGERLRMANAVAEAKRIVHEVSKEEKVQAQEAATKRRLEEIEVERSAEHARRRGSTGEAEMAKQIPGCEGSKAHIASTLGFETLLKESKRPDALSEKAARAEQAERDRIAALEQAAKQAEEERKTARAEEAEKARLALLRQRHEEECREEEEARERKRLEAEKAEKAEKVRQALLKLERDQREVEVAERAALQAEEEARQETARTVEEAAAAKHRDLVETAHQEQEHLAALAAKKHHLEEEEAMLRDMKAAQARDEASRVEAIRAEEERLKQEESKRQALEAERVRLQALVAEKAEKKRLAILEAEKAKLLAERCSIERAAASQALEAREEQKVSQKQDLASERDRLFVEKASKGIEKQTQERAAREEQELQERKQLTAMDAERERLKRIDDQEKAGDQILAAMIKEDAKKRRKEKRTPGEIIQESLRPKADQSPSRSLSPSHKGSSRSSALSMQLPPAMSFPHSPALPCLKTRLRRGLMDLDDDTLVTILSHLSRSHRVARASLASKRLARAGRAQPSWQGSIRLKIDSQTSKEERAQSPWKANRMREVAMGLGGIAFNKSWSMPHKTAALEASAALKSFYAKCIGDLPGEKLGFPNPHIAALTMKKRDRTGGKQWWRSVYFSRLFAQAGGVPGSLLLCSFGAYGERFSLMLCRAEDGRIMKQVTNSSHHPGAIFHQKGRYQLAILKPDGSLVEDEPARFESGRHLASGSHVVPPTLPVNNNFEAVLTELGALPLEGDRNASPRPRESHVRVVVAMYAFEQLLDLRHFQDHEMQEDDDEIDLVMLAGDSSGDSEPETPTRHLVTPTRDMSPFRDLRCTRRGGPPGTPAHLI